LTETDADMGEWVDVAAADEIEEGGYTLADIDGVEIAVFKVAGSFYAIEDVCTHDGGTLADGEVDGLEIECPRHGARFDLRSGKVTAPPAYEDVTTYATRVHNGRLEVCAKQPG
jgi:3-phenylpropionate/trans-cinnamate dioxygenase ferredoxin subunit